MSTRLFTALESGLVALPDSGRIAVFGARLNETVSQLPHDRVHAIQSMYPYAKALSDAGYQTSVHPEGAYSAALVCLPRSREQAKGWIAAARAATDGAIIVDGQKTDGVESMLKDARKRATVGAPLSKAHGKLFVVNGGDFRDWAAQPRHVGGMMTMPGVFSADRIDRASALLVDALPRSLSGCVADLGAGWGYLSKALLAFDAIDELHLVEADAIALKCAQKNIVDSRARFHWADATDFTPDSDFDTIVMNPPFHTDRTGDPALGQAFIRSAARMLKRNGGLWLVANRHLPYEQTLDDAFVEVTEVGQNPGFKIFHAARPRGRKRS